MKMFNRKLFSIMLLMNTLANTWCNGTEYTTLSSVIDKKIYNKDSNTVSNTFESYSDDNDNCIKRDINNYINDDFINPNPVPFLFRGTMTERNNQYYLDKMNEIMNGKYINTMDEDEEQSVPFIPLIVEYNSEYTLSKIIKEYNYNYQYTPRLTLDPSDKYTDREAQYFIDDLIKHGQVIDENVLQNIADKFGSYNINKFIDKYLSYICDVFNTLSNNEDILDYYELLNYNLIQLSDDKSPFFCIKSQNPQSNNVVFKKIQSNGKYNLLITLQINALQKPIANIFKNSNNINLMEKILYNTNKTNDNIFILDSVINSIISITKDDTFINNENNKNKLLNNFNMYIKNIRTADKMYIDNRLREISNNILFNDNFASCDTNQYNNLDLLINALKEQTSSFPKELINKNDLILSVKFNNENLKSILEYSFYNNTNNISNKNIKIIIDTLNDKNIDNNIKHNLLKHIVKLVVSSILNNNNKVDLDSFCTDFIYLLGEENFYMLNNEIQYLRHENTGETSQKIADIGDYFHDYFIKKMFEIKINNLVDIVKFDTNVSEECIKQRSQFISNVLYEILWNENNSKIFFQSLNNSVDNIYKKEFVNGIINFVLQNNIFKNENDNTIKQYEKNLIANLKNLKKNIKQIFKSNISVLLNENETQSNTNRKYILKQILMNLKKNVKIQNNNINHNTHINVNNQNNTNNINTQNIVNDQHIINNISNILDKEMKKYKITEIEGINNDNGLQSNDTISLLMNNNVKSVFDLVNSLNNSNNEQYTKTVLNSIIDFIVNNKDFTNKNSVHSKNLTKNFFAKLNNSALQAFYSLVQDKQKNVSSNTELYNKYRNLLRRCKNYINKTQNNNNNNDNNNSNKILTKKRNRTNGGTDK